MYIISPVHVGLPVITGADTVSVLPQLSVTVGGVGVLAPAGHVAAEVVLAGMVTTGRAIVVV